MNLSSTEWLRSQGAASFDASHPSQQAVKQNQVESESLESYFTCKHALKIAFESQSFCSGCGARVYPDCTTLKSSCSNYLITTSPLNLYRKTYLKAKTLPKVRIDSNPSYLQERERLINFMCSMARRIDITKQTQFLSIIYLDTIVCRSAQSTSTTKYPVEEHLDLYGGVALLLAAKSIELDGRVPYLSTIIDLMKTKIYKKDDVRLAETHAIQLLKFEFFLPTLLDLLSYYSAQGVVFSNDSFKTNSIRSKKQSAVPSDSYQFMRSPGSSRSTQPSNNPSPLLDGSLAFSPINSPFSRVQTGKAIIASKFYEIVQRIESDLVNLAFLLIKDPRFYDFELEVLSAACVCYLREKQNLSDPYRSEILSIGSQSKSTIMSCAFIFLSKFDAHVRSPVSSASNSQEPSPKRENIRSTEIYTLPTRNSAIIPSIFTVTTTQNEMPSISIPVATSSRSTASFLIQNAQDSLMNIKGSAPLKLSAYGNAQKYDTSSLRNSKIGNFDENMKYELRYSVLNIENTDESNKGSFVATSAVTLADENKFTSSKQPSPTSSDKSMDISSIPAYVPLQQDKKDTRESTIRASTAFTSSSSDITNGFASTIPLTSVQTYQIPLSDNYSISTPLASTNLNPKPLMRGYSTSALHTYQPTSYTPLAGTYSALTPSSDVYTPLANLYFVENKAQKMTTSATTNNLKAGGQSSSTPLATDYNNSIALGGVQYDSTPQPYTYTPMPLSSSIMQGTGFADYLAKIAPQKKEGGASKISDHASSPYTPLQATTTSGSVGYYGQMNNSFRYEKSKFSKSVANALEGWNSGDVTPADIAAARKKVGLSDFTSYQWQSTPSSSMQLEA